MIQDSLVEYVSSQMKLGVSRDAVKSALTGVGWSAIDVEDTLKKVESDKAQPAATAQPAAPMTQKPSMLAAAQTMPSGAVTSKPSSPLTSFSPLDIVSDVQSAPAQPERAAGMATGSPQSPAKNFFGKKTASAGDNKIEKMKMPSGAKEYPPKISGWKIADIIEAVIIVGLAALSGFLYFQNSALSAKVSGQNAGAASQVSGLTAQVQTLTASNADLKNKVASLTAESADMLTNLAFLAVPVTGVQGSSSPASVPTTGTATISGVLQNGARSSYVITTSYGVKVAVKNSSDANVRAALASLIGTTVQVTGTYLQGSALITVTAVNGSALTQNVSSTASSTTKP